MRRKLHLRASADVHAGGAVVIAIEIAMVRFRLNNRKRKNLSRRKANQRQKKKHPAKKRRIAA